MKKWVSFLAIVSLVAVSSILIYKEALARPMLCDTMEQMCWSCCGSFFYIYCIEIPPLIYCQFCCVNVSCPGWPCEWQHNEVCGWCVD